MPANSLRCCVAVTVANRVTVWPKEEGLGVTVNVIRLPPVLLKISKTLVLIRVCWYAIRMSFDPSRLKFDVMMGSSRAGIRRSAGVITDEGVECSSALPQQHIHGWTSAQRKIRYSVLVEVIAHHRIRDHVGRIEDCSLKRAISVSEEHVDAAAEGNSKSWPSLLKSPTATANGSACADVFLAAWKVPSPLPRTTAMMGFWLSPGITKIRFSIPPERYRRRCTEKP